MNDSSNTLNQMGNTIRNTSNTFQQGINNAGNNMSQALNSAEQSITNATQNISNNIQQFGSRMSTNISNSDFLTTNSIVAKTVFILLLLIVFMILLRVGVFILGYFISPNPNPYIVNGLIAGTTSTTVYRNPNKSGSVVLPRSNNQPHGLEATWSFWLNISNMNRSINQQNQFMHVFNVGDTTWISDSNNPNTVQDTLNTQSNSGYVKMRIIFDSESPTDTTTMTSIDIDDLPYNKWFHVAIRLENTVMDVYVNGLLTERLTFQSVPKQNYYDINIGQNGGFNGFLSNLQYYSRALNVFDLQNIIFWGPNLNAATVAGTTASSNLKNYDYLSSSWYYNKMASSLSFPSSP
jgi:Concanavalin A-like lectin/glucanases superfamily